MKTPRFFWRLIHFGPLIAYTIGLGSLIGRFVLLLTTVGRKSGRPRVTPLVYEERDGLIMVASARGRSSDWLRNIRTDPRVRVRVGRRQFDGIAEEIADPEQIADYLQSQLKRNPALFGAILHSEGISSKPSREELIRFAPHRPMVTIRALHDAA